MKTEITVDVSMTPPHATMAFMSALNTWVVVQELNLSYIVWLGSK